MSLTEMQTKVTLQLHILKNQQEYSHNLWHDYHYHCVKNHNIIDRIKNTSGIMSFEKNAV